MKTIDIKNPDLLEILDDFSTWFDTVKKSSIKTNMSNLRLEEGTGVKYLRELEERKEPLGYPEESIGIDMSDVSKIPKEYVSVLRLLNGRLADFFGFDHNAVKMYYPKWGYIGWHTNWNNPGYNVLLSWTKKGHGFFKYKLSNSEKTVTMMDKPGWTAKVGYFGPLSDPDKVVWHCAGAWEDRVTIAYVVPSKDIWENMIWDVSQE